MEFSSSPLSDGPLVASDSILGQQLVPPSKSTLQTVHNGVLWNGLRNILVEQGRKVWWIFDSTRGEIGSPDLQVEYWVKPQNVSPFGMVTSMIDQHKQAFRLKKKKVTHSSSSKKTRWSDLPVA